MLQRAVREGWPSLVAGSLALVLYAMTLAPGLTWLHDGADGGDLLAAALTGGVPHPSGYPTYQLLLRTAIAICPCEPARAGNWLSALCAGLAAGLLADLARRSQEAGPLRGAVAAAVGLTWAASPTLWGQAVITEVYTLNALLALLLLWLLWRWREAARAGRSGLPWLGATGLVLGVGLGNHLSLALMLPGMIAWFWSHRGLIGKGEATLHAAGGATGDEKLTQRRKGAKIYGLLGVLASLREIGVGIFRADAHAAGGARAKPPCGTTDEKLTQRHKEHKEQASSAGQLDVLVSLCEAGARIFRTVSTQSRAKVQSSAFIRARPRPIFGLVFLAGLLLGLTVYAYLPLAARGNPPVNWGDPQTPARLWWLVSGQVYRPLVFGLEPSYLPARLAAWGNDALRQLGGFWASLLALFGLWQLDQRDRAWWWLTVLAALAYSIYAIGYDTADSYVYLIPVWAVAALWLGAGLAAAIRLADTWYRRWREGAAGRRTRGETAPPPLSQIAARGLRIASILVLAALPAISIVRHWPLANASRDHEARAFVEAALAEARQDAIILTASDRPTFALWYARYGLGLRQDLIPVNVNLYDFPWYRDALAHAHPALAALFDRGEWPQLEEFIVRIAAQRPLYRAEPLNVSLAGLVEEPEGVLVRLAGGE